MAAQYTRAILIIGGSGFIGSHLAAHLRKGYKVFATYHKHRVPIKGVTSFPIDVSNQNWVKKVVYTVRPDAVVYVAGQNDMVSAETNQKDAERLHTEGVSNLATVAEVFQPKFIYLSNGYVYDGNHGNYLATSTVIPTSILGKVKVAGENAVRTRSLNHVIVRSSPLIGRGNGISLSFLDRIRMLLDRKARFELTADEFHAYAPIDGLIDVVEKLIESGIRKKVVHYGGKIKLSPYAFAKEFAQRFKYDGNLILPKTNETDLTKNGPLDFSLNSTATYELLKIKPLLLEESFDLLEKRLIGSTRRPRVA